MEPKNIDKIYKNDQTIQFVFKEGGIFSLMDNMKSYDENLSKQFTNSLNENCVTMDNTTFKINKNVIINPWTYQQMV